MINGGDNQTPYLHLNLGSDSVKNRNWALLDRALYDLARGSIANIPAGGDLTGFYPDPVIKDGAMTPAKIAAGGDPNEILSIDGTGKLVWVSAPPATPIGNAGGDLTGTYPNPTIKNGALTPNKIVAGGDPGEILSIDAGGNLIWVAGVATWVDSSGYLAPVKGLTYPVATGPLNVSGTLQTTNIVTFGATPAVSAVTLHAVQGLGSIINGATLWKFDVAQSTAPQPTFLETVTASEGWSTGQGSNWNVSVTANGGTSPQLRVMVQGDGRTYLPNTLGLRVGGGVTPREMLDVTGAVIIAASTAATPADGTLQYTSAKFQGRVAGAWVDIPGAGGGGGATSIGATAPVAPIAGQLWWRTTDGNLYIYYNDGNSTQWVPAMASVGTLAAPPAPTAVLVVSDTFESYVLGVITAPWTNVSGPQVSSGQAHGGAKSLAVGIGGNAASATLPLGTSLTKWILDVWLWVNAVGATAGQYIGLSSGGSAPLALYINPDGTGKVALAGGATYFTFSGVITGGWRHCILTIFQDAAAGTVALTIDGASMGTFTGDTRDNASHTSVNQVVVLGTTIGPSPAAEFYVDDLYVYNNA